MKQNKKYFNQFVTLNPRSILIFVFLGLLFPRIVVWKKPTFFPRFLRHFFHETFSSFEANHKVCKGNESPMVAFWKNCTFPLIREVLTQLSKPHRKSSSFRLSELIKNYQVKLKFPITTCYHLRNDGDSQGEVTIIP